MNTTPADGTEPNRPGGPAPTTPGTDQKPLSKAQKAVAATIGTGTAFIAALGFAGSYAAVTTKAHALGFGWFANWITIGVDAGIGIFLALDLFLTWIRIPFPLLRHIAWLLTAATITFNASASWPNPLGVGMHAVIPVLFIAATEAARHAVGRIADIVADKHMEGPPPSRWFLNPIGTFILWRRQRLWAIRLWDTVLDLERERRIYIGRLRREHGRAWRRKANADQLLVLRLAKDGMSITEATELPAKEEEKRRQEADRIAREAQQAEDARRREQQNYEREQQRLEDERLHKLEDERLEQERKALELEREREQAERDRQVAEAEHRGRLNEIARQEAETAASEERRQQQEQLAHARAVAAEQERAAEAARKTREDEEAAARAAAAKEAASRRAAEIVQRAASASATSRPTSASRTAASQPANGVTNADAGSASRASAGATSQAATTVHAANASSSQTAANGASAADVDQVVEVYQLLKEKDGTAPSDAKLGAALGVSRSRAQQLRTLAVEAGHTELAKPVRLAS